MFNYNNDNSIRKVIRPLSKKKSQERVETREEVIRSYAEEIHVAKNSMHKITQRAEASMHMNNEGYPFKVKRINFTYNCT